MQNVSMYNNTWTTSAASTVSTTVKTLWPKPRSRFQRLVARYMEEACRLTGHWNGCRLLNEQVPLWHRLYVWSYRH